jgi:hypothetical protein
MRGQPPGQQDPDMKLTRSAAIALSAAALAVAVGTPLAAQAATTHAAAPQVQPAATTSPAVYDCGNKPLAEPKTFVFTCDSSGYLTTLKWTSWNAVTATATGVLNSDNCKPSCANGKWTHQNVDVVLWRSEAVKGHPGQRGYTEMTVLFPNHSTRGGNTETLAAPGAFPGES